MKRDFITEVVEAIRESLGRRIEEASQEGYFEGYNRGVEKTQAYFEATLDEIPSEQDIADEIDKAYRDGWNDGRADLIREWDEASTLSISSGEGE